MGRIMSRIKDFLGKLLKKRWFWAVVLVIVVLIIVIKCVSNSNIGSKVLDLTQDFSQNEISNWKTQNKQKENEYVLNGGYYLHFKGVNYPVVFTEGSITQFDNMPDELFFYDIWELFTDSKCKHRCAIRAKYTKLYSFFKDAESWKGYILDSDRPKNGTILYFDETRERKFKIDYGNGEESERFGPDDPIILTKTISSTSVFGFESSDRVLTIAESDGVVFEEVNTVRKLYYMAKELGLAFNNQINFTTITCPDFFHTDWYYRYYAYDNIGEDRFSEKELQNTIKYAYTYLIVESSGLENEIKIDIDYCNDDLPNATYRVLLNSDAELSFENDVKSYSYSDMVKDSDGKVISYTYSNQQYKVFYGTIDEFGDFLMKDSIIDLKNQKAVSYFSLSEGGTDDFRDSFPQYNGLHISRYSGRHIYAVWDTYKSVMLHGNEDNEMAVCKNREYILPTTQKGGYEFVGWYTTSDYQGLPIEKITYDDDYSELFAKFDKVDHYTLSFEQFNGQTFDDITYSYGNEVLLPVLSKAFHAFKGWCTDSDLTSEPMKVIPEDFSGSYHLYPCFEPIEFSIKIIDSDKTTEVKVKYGDSFTLPIPSQKDEFLGYYDAYGVQYTDETGKSINPFTDGADIQLFAIYKTEE